MIKRRDFLTAGAGMIGAGIAGCSSTKQKPIPLWKELAPFAPRPASGSMPMRELGTTGIRLSTFGFGSHIRAEMRGYDYQRCYTIREAYELGVNVFDVYDEEAGVSIGGSYQYEPFGKQIRDFKNDIHISISFRPYDGRTPAEELERDLRLFGREYVDLVRILRPPENDLWDFLFKAKDAGKIRAVGAPIHNMEHVDMLLGNVPVDYILFPYNFYHNICWIDELEDDFDPLPSRLRQHNVGVMTMKPFAGDYLVQPFIQVARQLSDIPELSFPKAALRYVINSAVEPATTLVGMYNLHHLYENIGAYYNPAMSGEERKLLDDIRKYAVRNSHAILPDHYRWLDTWAGPSETSRTYTSRAIPK